MQARIYGCTPAEARCLVTIKLEKCRNTADLAAALSVAKGRVTRILDGLVDKGLVTRSEDANDRRLCLIHLTPKGIESTENLMSFILMLHGEVLKTLPNNLQRDTFQVLEVLKQATNSVRQRLELGEFSVGKQSSSV